MRLCIALHCQAPQDSAYGIAVAYAWLSDRNTAFEWLNRAYRQREKGLTDSALDPMLASLQGDPRFKMLLRKIKLAE